MAEGNDGGKMILYIVVAIIIILLIFFVIWWIMSPRAIVIPDCVQKQLGELYDNVPEQPCLVREYSVEVMYNPSAQTVTRDNLLMNLNKTVSIVYNKETAPVAKELYVRKLDLLTDAINGKDLPTIEKEIIEINTKLSVLYSQRLPQNLREEKGKQMLSILNKGDMAVISMALLYKEGKYVESFAAFGDVKKYSKEYLGLASWTLITLYSHDPSFF